jgi:quercetin dioxygenase-like cupin family protein
VAKAVGKSTELSPNFGTLGTSETSFLTFGYYSLDDVRSHAESLSRRLTAAIRAARAAPLRPECPGREPWHSSWYARVDAVAHSHARRETGKMRKSIAVTLTLVAVLAAVPSIAQKQGTARPQLLLREIVPGMPKGERQEVRVLTASFKPGDKTVFHTHRSPVTVYILEGAFTLELEGRAPVTVKAGEAFVEPPHVKMTGYNRSSSQPLRLVIFYVSDPDTPFLDPVP